MWNQIFGEEMFRMLRKGSADNIITTDNQHVNKMEESLLENRSLTVKDFMGIVLIS